MKGKERSPVKKRPRVPEDGRVRGGSHSGGKKPGAPPAAGGNTGNGASSRRNLHGEKKEHPASARPAAGYDHGPASGNKPHGGADAAATAAAAAAAEAPKSAPRGEARPPANPEAEYRALRISELGSQLDDEEIEDGLFHEFKKFGDVSVKMGRENDERVAFVNFRRADDARAAKHARGRLVLHDRPLKIEPVYVNRRRSRSPVSKDGFPPGQRHPHPPRALSPAGSGYRDFRLQQLALGRLPAPQPPHLRDLERDREFSVYDARGRPPFFPELAVFRDEELVNPEEEQRANRTLFLGNLDVGVTEGDLRRAFDRFGAITEVDIKRAVRGQTSTYGFIKFENLDMAHRAKLAMSGKLVGHNPVKIGYGKPTPTTRLWVGGLGPWVPLAALAKEFDRFGTIRTIDYRKGEAWAYIQYESLDAAQAACTHMRGFPLGGPDHRLRVDFADTEHRYQPPPYLQLPLPLPHYDLVPEPFAHHLTDPLRVRERSPPLPPPRFRDRDLYSPAEWPGLGVHERMRGAAAAFDPLERLERHPRDAWAAEQEWELQSRDVGRKRRYLDDGWRLERSPDGSDYAPRRHCSSLERSPGGSSRDGQYSDSERQPRSGRTSPARERQNGQDAAGAVGEKKRRTLSPAAPGSEKDRKRQSKDPARKDETGESLSAAKPGAKSKAAAAGAQKLSRVWQGALLLKNSSFPATLHLLGGDVSVATGLLVDGPDGGPVSQLKITQRLRLDQPKLDEVSRRIRAAGPAGHAVLLATPGKPDDGADAGGSNERPLKNLVSYLKQKEAAGIVTLPVGGARDKDHGGVLQAFPPCDFSQRFLDASAKAFAKSDDDHMVVIILRGAS